MAAALLAVVLLAPPLPAEAAEILEAHQATQRSLTHLSELAEVNGPYVETAASVSTTARRSSDPPERPPRPPKGAEGWRPLVERYFKAANVTWALTTLMCESGGNPNFRHPRTNQYGRAQGLFSHMSLLFPDRAVAAGWGRNADVFDPETNIAVAAWLFYENQGRRAWPYCGYLAATGG